MKRNQSSRGAVGIRAIAMVALGLGLSACASGGGAPAGDRRPAHDPPHHDARGRSEDRVLSVHLASSQPSHAVPVIRRDTADRLRLSFDVAGDGRKFYTAQFYPATRDWQISSGPEEGILPPPDDITNYETSTDLDFPYVQYSYEFPNSRVDFYRSGNFLLQVTNARGDLLFERRFYVSDHRVPIEIAAKSSSLITERPDELVPEARVELPNDPWFSPSDCSVRFLKNGWSDQAFDVDISRVEGDAYVFEAPRVFRLTVPVYSADLRGNTGIRRRDEITVPITVSLLPDDMRFWGDDYRFSSPVPRRTSLPDVTIRYVSTQFVVQNGPRGAAPYLVGTFNDWEIDPAFRLNWNAETEDYEIQVPLREEQFFYTYAWEDPNTVRPQSKFEGPETVVFTTIVYAKDTRYPTERILAVRSQPLSSGN